MTSIQPELWVDAGLSAVSFYTNAFGATSLHMVGEGEDVVAQLAIGEAVFWVATAGASSERLVPRTLGGSTGRVLLVVDDPAAVQTRAIAAGATEKSPVDREHGWLVGRVTDPFGHEWEIGKPLSAWPPTVTGEGRPSNARYRRGHGAYRCTVTSVSRFVSSVWSVPRRCRLSLRC